jgi:hypothetical protein
MLDDAPSLKERLSKDAFLNPVLLFISPRGHGLKIIVRVKNGEADCHEQYFEALVHYMKGAHGIKIDQSGSDISRLCFLCWDPEPYWFEDGFVTAEDLLKLLPKTQPSSSPSANFVETLKKRCNPGDRLNRTPAVHELAVSVLKNHGWKPKDDKSDLWVRAGKKIREGHSARYSFYPHEGIHFLYNFSSNAQPFLQNKAYTDVQVICEMDYAGDFKKCISELSRRYSEPRDTM